MASKGDKTPPTKVQTPSVASILILGKKGEVDAIDDADLGWFDDDSVDQSAEDFTTCWPVGLRQVGADRFAEAVHAGQRFTQGGLFS